MSKMWKCPLSFHLLKLLKYLLSRDILCSCKDLNIQFLWMFFDYYLINKRRVLKIKLKMPVTIFHFQGHRRFVLLLCFYNHQQPLIKHFAWAWCLWGGSQCLKYVWIPNVSLTDQCSKDIVHAICEEQSALLKWDIVVIFHLLVAASLRNVLRVQNGLE